MPAPCLALAPRPCSSLIPFVPPDGYCSRERFIGAMFLYFLARCRINSLFHQHISERHELMPLQNCSYTPRHAAQTGVMPQPRLERPANAWVLRIKLPWMEIDYDSLTERFIFPARQLGVSRRKDPQVSAAGNGKIGPQKTQRGRRKFP